MVPYADTSFGHAYFADRLHSDAWDSATLTDRVKALKTATRMIDTLNFVGCKANPDQEYQFPRGDDTEVPTQVKQACCELALALLDDVDPNLEIENLVNIEQSVGNFRTKRTSEFVLEHIANGIPSIQAWALLKPFIRGSSLHIDRS